MTKAMEFLGSIVTLRRQEAEGIAHLQLARRECKLRRAFNAGSHDVNGTDQVLIRNQYHAWVHFITQDLSQ